MRNHFRTSLGLIAVLAVATVWIATAAFATNVTVDFDTALQGASSNATADNNANGMEDGPELGLVSTILADDTIDLSSGSATGQVAAGVLQADVLSAWQANQTQMATDVSSFPTFVDALAGFMTLGDTNSVTLVVTLAGGAGITIDPNNYNLTQAPFLSADGDADGDGATNKEEYDYFFPLKARADYLSAALDPATAPPPPPPPSAIPTVPAGAPATDALGLGLLTLVVAGGGALMIRRKK